MAEREGAEEVQDQDEDEGAGAVAVAVAGAVAVAVAGAVVGAGEGADIIQNSPLYTLPNEMLQILTRVLPVSDRKNVALVSKLWEEHAFHNMDDIKLQIKGSLPDDRDLQILHKSGRPFRHLVFDFGRQSCSELDLDMIMDTLTVIGSGIKSFALRNRCTLRQLKGFIDRLPNLEFMSLSLVEAAVDPIDPRELPVMSHLKELHVRSTELLERWMTTCRPAPNVVKLYVNLMGRFDGLHDFADFIRLFEDKLESFELVASSAMIPYHQLSLRLLHTFKLCVQYNPSESRLCTFFTTSPVLQVALLHLRISDNVLEAVCTNCVFLYKLRFTVDAMRENCFRFLERLNHLRILIIDGCLTGYMIEDCSPLTSVEQFWLTTNPRASMEPLSRLLPRLRMLKLDFSEGMQMNDRFIQDVCCHFTQIRCLSIDSDKFCSVGSVEYVTPQVFSHLMRLTNLQELTLSCMRTIAGNYYRRKDKCLFVYFMETALRDWSEHTSLTRLTLKNCPWVQPGILTHFVNVFSSMRCLDVIRCPFIAMEDIHAAMQGR